MQSIVMRIEQALFIVKLGAVFGVLALSLNGLQAEDDANVGIARISDRPASVSESSPAVLQIAYGAFSTSNYWSCPQCGRRPLPGCAHRPAPCPLEIWAAHSGACTYSPDHGWSRPVKYPIRRAAVQYRRYWPKKWYGEPGSGLSANSQYPTVFMPTDTTQLGYYYQRVPTWLPNPAMLPTPPWPTTWHRRECPIPKPSNGCQPAAPKVQSKSPAAGPSPPKAKQDNPSVPAIPTDLNKSAAAASNRRLGPS